MIMIWYGDDGNIIIIIIIIATTTTTTIIIVSLGTIFWSESIPLPVSYEKSPSGFRMIHTRQEMTSDFRSLIECICYQYKMSVIYM